MTFDEILNWQIPVLITDMESRVLKVNKFWEELYGATSVDFIGLKSNFMKSGYTARSVYEDLNKGLQNTGAWSGVIVNRHLSEKRFLIISLTIMQMELEGQKVYVSLHQRIDQLSVESAASIGSLQTVEGIFLQSIAKIAEWNDPDLENHVHRVSKLARWIAEMANKEGLVSDADVDLIEAASVVHDIGKAAITKEILFKPGGLTEGERTLVKDHASIGGEMIRMLFRQMESFHSLHGRLFEFAMASAMTHHEWWNGHGYPRGLKGENIPIVGRIVALADVMDALLSNRPYKRAWMLTTVREYITNKNGKQFDPVLVNLILKNWDGIYTLYQDSLEVQIGVH